jgi:hypothetical protein
MTRRAASVFTGSGESGQQVDVQFADGGVVRGALEDWFELDETRTEGEQHWVLPTHAQSREMVPAA